MLLLRYAFFTVIIDNSAAAQLAPLSQALGCHDKVFRTQIQKTTASDNLGITREKRYVGIAEGAAGESASQSLEVVRKRT